MNTQKKIALIGATGRMGKCVIECAQNHNDWYITTPIARDLSDLWDTPAPADIVVDFSNAEMTAELAKRASGKNIPLLICTTGLTEETNDVLAHCSITCPVMIAPNTSIGILLLRKMLKEAASTLDDTFDIDIIETHHRNKVDAPSGTAISLRETLQTIRSTPVGMHSIRAGDVIAEHSVSFRGDHETITLTHTANGRHVFADGALRLAKWLIKQKPGFYTPEDAVS
ncbi:MAG: dihydrodipicolinate reductase C-terminal domain-containing protein [Pseudomonadota bacterium]